MACDLLFAVLCCFLKPGFCCLFICFVLISGWHHTAPTTRVFAICLNSEVLQPPCPVLKVELSALYTAQGHRGPLQAMYRVWDQEILFGLVTNTTPAPSVLPATSPTPTVTHWKPSSRQGFSSSCPLSSNLYGQGSGSLIPFSGTLVVIFSLIVILPNLHV